MTRDRLYLYDTTLRDGQQTQGVQFSVPEKIAIAEALDAIGIDYIEGGWPGANPTDSEFFAARPDTQATFTAFGMTKRAGRSAANDDVLAGVMNAGTPAVCLVGKTHDYHVTTALGITLDENLENIRASVAHMVAQGREALFDAEHFFDGYKANAPYALQCVLAAYEAGARWVVLCDTNGGTLPNEVEQIVGEVVKVIPGDHVGIHAHNDTEQAVANSLAAVRAGARQIHQHAHHEHRAERVRIRHRLQQRRHERRDVNAEEHDHDHQQIHVERHRSKESLEDLLGLRAAGEPAGVFVPWLRIGKCRRGSRMLFGERPVHVDVQQRRRHHV